MNTVRRNSGTMLVLSCACFAFVALTMVIGYSMCGVYFIHNRLQNSADEIALVAAKKLNEADRVGKMNNMVVRCRQLVYSSRDDYERTRKDFKHLESFAQPFLDEARQSASTLETERSKLSTLVRAEASAEAQRKFDEVKDTYRIALPWLRLEAPQMMPIEFGIVDGVESNVQELTGFADLAKDDRAKNLVAVYPAMAVYRAEKDHKLGGADGDLTFKLSSLDACVKNELCSARILSPAQLRPARPDYTPSVAKVSLKLTLSSGLGFTTSSRLESSGAACTTGAGNQQ